MLKIKLNAIISSSIITHNILHPSIISRKKWKGSILEFIFHTHETL